MSFVPLIKQAIKYPLNQLAARFGHHRRRTDESRLWIMMYHRILPKTDPRYSMEEPGMIVEPDTFRMHLQVLKQEFTIISLKEWINRWQMGQRLPAKSCVITFDDGWLDNYEYALEIVEQEGVPATLFAVSEMIGTKQSFWPNRVVNLLKQGSRNIQKIDWLYQLVKQQPVDRELSAQAIYALKGYADDKLIKMIAEAEAKLDISPPNERSLMNWDELKKLADHPLIDIGSHTCHHFRLREDLALETMRQEIIQSKQHLEQRITQSVDLFCYPNGDTCEASIELVTKHYRAAVTTQRGFNEASSLQTHQLKRIPVHQDSSDTPVKLLARVACWP